MIIIMHIPKMGKDYRFYKYNLQKISLYRLSILSSTLIKTESNALAVSVVVLLG